MKARDVAVFGALAGTLLAATTGSGVSEVVRDDGSRAAGRQERVSHTPTGFGAKYDAAVVRMTSINHLLEKRQAELFYARQRGESTELVAHLRRRVASLERGYADAIVAMAQATR